MCIRRSRTCQDQLDNGGCFAAGTPLRTPEGSQAVERLGKGDRVLSRSEHDQDGPVEARMVVEVFRRLAAVWQLHVRGRIIGTTAEHPFWVKEKGWTPARLVEVGDWLRTHDSEWVTVEGVRETTEVVLVYNIQVEDYHSYFVGGTEWGFSVWAHNTGDGCSEPTSLPQAQNGSVTVEQSALDYAAKSSAEQAKLGKLIQTANQLANQGFDVRVLGEDPAQPGDLAIEGPGVPNEVPAQSKLLDAGTQTSVKRNLSDGTTQADDGGYTIIDGSQAGLTAEIFEAGFQQFLRNSVSSRAITGEVGASGTVIVILGDGTILTQTFP